MSLIKLFQRSTNSKNFIPEIDGLRFFSIITVMLFHLNTAFSREIGIGLDGWSEQVGVDHPWQFGWWLIRMDLGVKVFFAISGFILGLPFLKQLFFGGNKIILKDYFLRRLTRLEPPFILTLVGFYLVHVFVLKESIDGLFPNFLAGLVYAHVFIFGGPNPINPVTWSLETEAQFYLILPFIAYFCTKLNRKSLAIAFFFILVLASAYFRGYSLDHGLAHLSSSIFAYFINFGIGIIFAYIYLSFPSYFGTNKSILFDGIGVLAFLGIFYFYKPQALIVNNILFNFSVILLFISVFKGKWTNWLFTLPWVYLIGGMCYSIYLIHYAFFYFMVRFSSRIFFGEDYWSNYALQILLVFPAVIGVSALFYLAVEKPCMDKNWPFQLSGFIRKKLSS